MRFRVIDRMVSALSGLLVLCAGIGLFVFGIGILPFRLDLSFLDRSFVLWQRAVMVVVALVLCYAGLRGVSLLFRSSKEKGFVLQHTEYGDLSISMSAMENMVKKCVDAHNELKVSNTRIHHARDGVIIAMRIALANGVNIPLTVSALQKQIKQYITSCSGVDVKEVRVMVETNNGLMTGTCAAAPDTLKADVAAATRAGEVVDSLHEAVQNAMPPEPETKESDEREPIHQRLFRRDEKPQIVPEPPVEIPTEAAQAVASSLSEETPAAVNENDGADTTQDTVNAVEQPEQNQEEEAK